MWAFLAKASRRMDAFLKFVASIGTHLKLHTLLIGGIGGNWMQTKKMTSSRVTATRLLLSAGVPR